MSVFPEKGRGVLLISARRQAWKKLALAGVGAASEAAAPAASGLGRLISDGDGDDSSVRHGCSSSSICIFAQNFNIHSR